MLAVDRGMSASRSHMRIRIRNQAPVFAFEYGFGASGRIRPRMSERAVKFPVFLANIQALMNQQGWDQNELGDRVGASQSSVSRWGYQSVPRGQTLAKLASLAEVDPADIIEVPLTEARRARRVSLPNGSRLSEMMAALLDSAGLPHLADEYAPKLARLLPALLEGGEAPLADQKSAASKRRGAPVRGRATIDHDKRQ